ncbi:MAG: TIGR03943 family putative permease subunit [Angustibacter sp.]
MSDYVQGLILAVLGVVVLRVALTGEYLNYVKPQLQPYLVVSAGLLAVLGGVAIWRSIMPSASLPDAVESRHDSAVGGREHSTAVGGREHSTAVGSREHSGPEQDGQRQDGQIQGQSDEHGGHEHGGPRVGWLLLLPVVTLFAVAPPALGADAAARDSGVVRAAPGEELADLPETAAGAPLPLTVLDLSLRSADPQTGGLRGRLVRVDGFVSEGPGGRWYVTRMMMACCAADGIAVKAEVRGAARPPLDSWIQVEGIVASAASADGETPPAIQVQRMQPIPVPREPYL